MTIGQAPISAIVSVVNAETRQIIEGLNVIQGSTVTRDRTQAIRGACDLYVPDPTGSLSSSSLLLPTSESGNLLQVTGYLSGVPSTMGTFAIQNSNSKDMGSTRTIEITGQDRAWLIARRKLVAAYNVVAGTEWSMAFQALLNFRLVGLSYAGFSNITLLTPSIVLNPADEAWTKMASEWAPAVGCELYFTVNDAPALQPVPDPRTQAVSWTLSEGTGCTFVEVDHATGDNTVPNVWVVDGTAPGVAPSTASSSDLNPNSPTWAGSSTYGVVWSYTQDTLVTSSNQAQLECNLQLALGLGAGEPVTLYLVPNPAYDAGQVALVTRAAQGLEQAIVVFDTVKHALFPGDQTQITGRRIWPWPT